MSWQSQWGTVKATNARACALYYEVANVGKTIESSKKRVIWRLKVEEGREFEISLTHSLASGKKVLRVDGIVKYTSQSMSFGDWDYVFNLPGGHVVHTIIKPSVELNDMYDLIIDNVSFRRLPDRLDANKAKTVVKSSSSGGSHKPTTSTYNYSNGSYSNRGNSSRENSFTPWECTRCTLVNEKPLAPTCEACGELKPSYISPEARQRAKTTAATRIPPTSATRAPSTTVANTKMRSQSDHVTSANAFEASDPFALSNAAAFPSSFTSSQPAQKPVEDITSMLSGLDFTAAPVQEKSSAQDASQMAFDQPKSPNPADDSNARTGSGDLWESNIVDLNLKPAEKQRKMSAKSYQTLEQARLRAPKEKVQVLPTPPPQQVMMTSPAPSMMYANHAPVQTTAFYPQGMNNQHMMGGTASGMQPQYATSAGFGMNQAPTGFGTSIQAGAMNAYATGMYVQPHQQQQPFMTQATKQPPSTFGSDPFATLS